MCSVSAKGGGQGANFPEVGTKLGVYCCSWWFRSKKGYDCASQVSYVKITYSSNKRDVTILGTVHEVSSDLDDKVVVPGEIENREIRSKVKYMQDSSKFDMVPGFHSASRPNTANFIPVELDDCVVASLIGMSIGM